jgi:hypothetical protein
VPNPDNFEIWTEVCVPVRTILRRQVRALNWCSRGSGYGFVLFGGKVMLARGTRRFCGGLLNGGVTLSQSFRCT